jgi:hypothetical protein
VHVCSVCKVQYLIVGMVVRCRGLQCTVPDVCCGSLGVKVNSVQYLTVGVVARCVGLQCAVPDGWCGSIVCRFTVCRT